MRTPADKRVVFTLYSHPMKEAKLRWKATLAFEPGSTDRSFAALEIKDGEGGPVEKGVFEFAGAKIKVKDGVGRLKCAQFVKGKHEGAIWLHRKGQPPVPGALTFE